MEKTAVNRISACTTCRAVCSSTYPQHFFGMLAGGNLNELLVKNILLGLPEGTSEIMTHPGADNVLLAQNFKWGYHWHDELNAFLSESNKNIAREQGIELINFGRL